MDCEIRSQENVWFSLVLETGEYVCKLKSVKYAFGWRVDRVAAVEAVPRDD
jgi:hypothetical protein